MGAEIIDSDEGRDLVVNKIARTLRQGTLWTRNRDGKASLLPARIFICKEDLLIIIREFAFKKAFRYKR